MNQLNGWRTRRIQSMSLRIERTRWSKDWRVKNWSRSFAWRKQETSKIKKWANASIQEANETYWHSQKTKDAYWKCQTFEFYWGWIYQIAWD